MMDLIEGLTQVLKEAKVTGGDILSIPSDITQLLRIARKEHGVATEGKRNEFLNDLVDTFQKAVGPEGTLLFPTFTWDFNHGLPFDIRSTPGKVGSLPNWILKNRRDFIRTQHPMYSFMVWGKDAHLLAGMNNADCWGQYSPFGYMYRNDAKALFLNVSVQRGFTFVHYVEETLQVPYRYYKNFSGDYIDAGGNKSRRSYVMYVRDTRIISSEYSPDSFYEEKDILKAFSWAGMKLSLMNCRDAFDAISDDLLNNGGRNIYHFDNYEIDWTTGHTHADEIDN